MNYEALHRLSARELRELTASLRDGRLSHGWSTAVLERQFRGSGEMLRELLDGLQSEGLAPAQVALLTEAVMAEKLAVGDPARVVELVLSGPEAPGVPTADTPAQMRALFEAAEVEVLVLGYAFYQAAHLFEPLVERMRAIPGFRVVFAVNVMPGHAGEGAEEMLKRFAAEFRLQHWPWPELPELYYDPRSLQAGSHRASLHAKCVVADRRAALVTSANFTAAAQERNIEAGLLVRHAPVAERLAGYFDALVATGQLCRCALDPSSWDS